MIHPLRKRWRKLFHASGKLNVPVGIDIWASDVLDYIEFLEGNIKNSVSTVQVPLWEFVQLIRKDIFGSDA